MQYTKLENEYVKLKPLELNDAEGIFAVGTDEKIWRYMSVQLHSKADVQQYVNKALKQKENGAEYPFVIIDVKTNNIIGSTRFLDISLQHKRLEIGSTWITPCYWRTAINTNCKYLLLEYCFETIGMNRVQIKTDHENIRSQKAIERLGAVKEGILRNHMIRRDGTIRHTVMYSITKEEWAIMKEQFRKWDKQHRLIY
ncbi:GNAT family N-acetyltransferase [Ectobacillus polymachus]|uniref:GNAT family N-acetyltransferase n=1 Tax=Ectobacillus polymachus TaxID=1508806 RepID=UPI003A8A662E